MKFKTRLLFASVVAFVIPVLSWILYPELGWEEPVGFIALVVLLYGGYEVIIAIQKRKRK